MQSPMLAGTQWYSNFVLFACPARNAVASEVTAHGVIEKLHLQIVHDYHNLCHEGALDKTAVSLNGLYMCRSCNELYTHAP